MLNLSRCNENWSSFENFLKYNTESILYKELQHMRMCSGYILKKNQNEQNINLISSFLKKNYKELINTEEHALQNNKKQEI